MTPGTHNGLFGVIIEQKDDYREDVRLGFYVADAAKDEDVFAVFKQDAADLDLEQKQKRLEGVKQELTDMGYETGPIESKTHQEWVNEVFGVTNLPEVDMSEIDAEFDAEFDDEAK